jgi:DNA-binding response OmpR family regulator
MKGPLTPTTEPVSANVLSVSPVDEDHYALERIFYDVAGSATAERPWALSRTRTLASARTALWQGEYAVVMCERDLDPGSWQDLLESVQRLSNPPYLIVTSRHADDYLWAEALNLGAHDVLAKPFDTAEVIRVVNLACGRWQRQRHHAGQSITVKTAASGMRAALCLAQGGLF